MSDIPQAQLHLIMDRAIEDRALKRALFYARQLEKVELDQALRLTLLLGREGDPRYIPAARRFIARFAEEAEPTLIHIKKVADALDTIRNLHDLPAMREGADHAMEDLARQLRERRDPDVSKLAGDLREALPRPRADFR